MLTAKGDDSTRSSASSWAPTTTSPSPSTRGSSWRASAPCSGERGRTRRRGGAPAGWRDRDRLRGPRGDGEGPAPVLTHYEFELLAALARVAGRVLSREHLLDSLKGQDYEAFDRSIDVHISKLRAKLEADPKEPRYIKTVRGVGYVLMREAPRAMARLHSRIYLHFLGVLVVAGLATSLVFAVGAAARSCATGSAPGPPRRLAGRRGLRGPQRPRAAPAGQMRRDLDVDLRVRGADGRVVAPPAGRSRARRVGEVALAREGARGGPPAPRVGRGGPGAGSAARAQSAAPSRRPRAVWAGRNLLRPPRPRRYLPRGGGRDAAPGPPHLAPARAPHRGRAPPRRGRPRRRAPASCARAGRWQRRPGGDELRELTRRSTTWRAAWSASCAASGSSSPTCRTSCARPWRGSAWRSSCSRKTATTSGASATSSGPRRAGPSDRGRAHDGAARRHRPARHLAAVDLNEILTLVAERARHDPVTAGCAPRDRGGGDARRRRRRAPPPRPLEPRRERGQVRRAAHRAGAESTGGPGSIWVDDAGPGIAPAERERVAILLSRRRPVRATLGSARTPGAGGEPPRGVGLGLTLARRVAEVHDGALAIGPASTDGGRERGCRVVITIPASPGRASN